MRGATLVTKDPDIQDPSQGISQERVGKRATKVLVAQDMGTDSLATSNPATSNLDISNLDISNLDISSPGTSSLDGSLDIRNKAISNPDTKSLIIRKAHTESLATERPATKSQAMNTAKMMRATAPDPSTDQVERQFQKRRKNHTATQNTMPQNMDATAKRNMGGRFPLVGTPKLLPLYIVMGIKLQRNM